MVKGKRDVDGIEFLTYHLIELFFKLFSKIYCQIRQIAENIFQLASEIIFIKTLSLN